MVLSLTSKEKVFKECITVDIYVRVIMLSTER